jgi:Protein of unknown function (DUF1552)
MKTTPSRRQFVSSIVGSATASQLMTLLPHAAFSQGSAPKRLLCVFHPMGYLENSFWPTGEGTSFTLGETQQALNPYKNKLLYIDGLMHSHRAYWEKAKWDLHGKDNEHGSGINGIFTGSWIDDSGYAAGPSIDQTIANALFAQNPTAYKSINLAVAHGDGTHDKAFFVSAGNPINPLVSAKQSFDTLFAKLQTSGTAPDNTAFLKMQRQKQRVIDNTRAELKAVCDRIGSEEKAMCDAHLAGIAQLENRLKGLQPTLTAGCTKSAVPGTATDVQSSIRAQMDVVRTAFACDLSRVATLQIGNADGGVDVGGLVGQHETTHATGEMPSAQVTANHKKWDTWWSTQWAYLLSQLASVSEGNGTLLDNTLIVFGSDTTTGQSLGVGAHQSFRFPMWIAGGSNFAFRTGRTVKLPYMVSDDFGRYGSQWTYHNALLVSVAKAMGLNINAFGTWDQGRGGVPGLV